MTAASFDKDTKACHTFGVCTSAHGYRTFSTMSSSRRQCWRDRQRLDQAEPLGVRRMEIPAVPWLRAAMHDMISAGEPLRRSARVADRQPVQWWIETPSGVGRWCAGYVRLAWRMMGPQGWRRDGRWEALEARYLAVVIAPSALWRMGMTRPAAGNISRPARVRIYEGASECIAVHRARYAAHARLGAARLNASETHGLG